MESNLTGKVVEVAGTICGLVIQDNEKTLLIRKAELHSDEFVLCDSATFYTKSVLVNAYWLRFLDKSSVISVPINSITASNLIGKLLNM